MKLIDFIDILPAIHALTGCDTTSKMGTKKKAIKKENKNAYHLLCYFGKNKISVSMIADAEKFLVQCITSDDTDDFDNLMFIIKNIYGLTLKVSHLDLVLSDIFFVLTYSATCGITAHSLRIFT